MPPADKENTVRSMFTRIASRYDRANRWMTFGQDVKWRRRVLDFAQLPQGGRLLDVGSGTGDLALEAYKRDGSIIAIAADFAAEIIKIGRGRGGRINNVHWLNNDALDLPFSKDTFDTVVSGYLLRNVCDLERALAEQYRVLKPGGTMVCLDTTPPPRDLWHLPVRFYLRQGIPFIGRFISGDKNAYEYLQQSTEGFVPADELARRMVKVGFQEVLFSIFMAGSMAIHRGKK